MAPPNVVSVSYGQDEASVTPAYAQRQCTEYGKLGMMGTTVLYSSGDDGVAGGDGECLNARGEFVVLSIQETTSNGNTGFATPNGTRFNPGFPVTCPFVTAVGATQINPGSTVNDPEGACEQVIFSGGGFSNFFALPSYQEAAVTNFLKEHPPPFTSAQFNDSGKVTSISRSHRVLFLNECVPLGSRIPGSFGEWVCSFQLIRLRLYLTIFYSIRANYIIGKQNVHR